ncbi:hypothetical protein BKP56_07080 [Marinilactibacillus sp. 15R]|uniref:hypothetical protein n=1 Tax=Marinilactibacillus sp. 15R TaxID=1911586 RepID=UPI00090AA96D|nr:hypothetical protein [Marinilactibacillus sp. 15R]API89031.1 hypothetical protein BKP56_07080 [Marinilactibacillus sp. 15R]
MSSQDKLFYDAQNKAITKIEEAIEHHKLEVISSELAMVKTTGAIYRMNKEVEQILRGVGE